MEMLWKLLPFALVKHILPWLLKSQYAPIVRVAFLVLAGIIIVGAIAAFIEWFWGRIKGHDKSKDSDSKAKATAVETLGSSGDIRIIEPLLTTLEDDDNTREAEIEQRYKLINSNLQAILESIPRESHIMRYDYLMTNRDKVSNIEYQKRYKNFYRLRGLSSHFCHEYFKILKINLTNLTNLEKVVNQLYDISRNVNDDRSLQFSFASKLIHTVDPHSPIYDSKVKGFYCFSEPAGANSVPVRITGLLEFHNKLISEYQRVKDGLLTQAIQQFRQYFNPESKTFTDEKVIDSLIWASEKWWKPEKRERHAKRQPASEKKSMDGMIKRVELRASQSAVETEVLKTLYAYEELVLRVRHSGRRVRAIYTWRMFYNHGIIEAIEIMMRKTTKQPGLIGLIEIGRQDLTFEALVVRHPESFTQEAVKLAKQRLEEAIRA